MERTLALIKPDAVNRNLQGEIITMMQKANLKIIAMKMLTITKEEAAYFYMEHKGKPFYETLINYMTSAPIVALVLEGKNAIKDYRTLMGATNPENADEGTIRKIYGLKTAHNSVHGSDSPESAKREIACFFNLFSLI